MKSNIRTFARMLVSFLFVAGSAPWLNAQITNPIRARIDHSFMIGDKTLPPGDYTFRIMDNSDLSIMTVSNENGKVAASFGVREAIADPRPSHSEIVFRKYGDAEFLSKVFEGGSKTGVAVTESSNQEQRFLNQGQHAMEHSEEQK
jgi:hypothetical protein